MFENLSDKLDRAFKVLKGQGKITEINVAETVKEVRKALLEADVNYKVAKTFTDKVKETAMGQNVFHGADENEVGCPLDRGAHDADGSQDADLSLAAEHRCRHRGG